MGGMEKKEYENLERISAILGMIGLLELCKPSSPSNPPIRIVEQLSIINIKGGSSPHDLIWGSWQSSRRHSSPVDGRAPELVEIMNECNILWREIAVRVQSTYS